MHRFALAIALLSAASGAFAGDMGSGHSDMAGMDHASHMAQMADDDATPVEGGQSAFAAIQEIVELLEADPRTDWSKVDVEALRQHLVDMDNVTLRSVVTSEDVENGVRFSATGTGAVVGSIRRMVAAHAATMNGVGGWSFAAGEISDGAALTVTVADPGDLMKVRAIGFIGVMTRGVHHQMHHLMIASGTDPHH